MLNLLLVDVGGQQSSKSFLDDCSAPDAKLFMQSHSSAGVVGINDIQTISVSPTLPSEGADVERKAYMYYRDGSGIDRSYCLPAFRGLATVMTEEGERVTPDSGLTACTAHATLLGFTTENLQFHAGVIVDRQ